MGIISEAIERREEDAPISMIGIDHKPASYSHDELAKMDHATLYGLRERNAAQKLVYAALAPYEHRAFAREATDENLGLALPIALATPLYAGAKALGLMKNDGTTTPPSFSQVGQGLLGVGEGVISRVRKMTSL